MIQSEIRLQWQGNSVPVVYEVYKSNHHTHLFGSAGCSEAINQW